MYKGRDKLVCIDFFNAVHSNISASQLFRFLGKWELNFPNIQLIVFNIKTKLIFELKLINDFYASLNGNIDYWNDKKATLIYSYEELEREENKTKKKEPNRFYFTDILFGKNEQDFKYINDKISSNYFNAITKDRNFFDNYLNKKSIEEKWEGKLPKQLFDAANTILPFDLLIKDSFSDKPLFIFNTETLLQNRMGEEKMEIVNELSLESIKKSIQNLQQHKIENTHFRLGSKIHLSDFYYAKPFFQNSFYAQKYAFLVAYHIIQKYLAIDSSKINELSLIGYGLYSELLISFIKILLKKYNEEISVNCNSVNDYEDIRLNKTSEIYDNAIIIIPIATTFSTSIKIVEMLQKRKKAPRILLPHINILLVADKSLEKIDGKVNQGILEQFGWDEIDKKNTTVKIKSLTEDNELIEQKYFIAQLTKWNTVHDCNICFPDNHKRENDFCVKHEKREDVIKDKKTCFACKNNCILKEKLLFDTDKTSLTPELIFGFPKARIIKTEQKVKLTSEALYYGHVERNLNHYHYYFNDSIFWTQNKDKVRSWLENEVKEQLEKEMKNNEDNEISSSESDQIVILSPGHFSNADFVCMINETLFGNKATIIHYDSNIESPQNFELFYGKAIVDANRIYFADDVTTSGATFINANSFIKRIKKNEDGVTQGFSGCLFFLNRSGYYEYEDIKRKLGHEKEKTPIYAFANLHIPYIKSYNNTCPLCDELEKYTILENNSLLTKVRRHFLKQQTKLKFKRIVSEKLDLAQKHAHTNIVGRVEAIHRIYEWMSDIENNHNINFKVELLKPDKKEWRQWEGDTGYMNSWIEDLLARTKSPFDETQLSSKKERPLEGCLVPEKYLTILKILTQPPFYNYKILREKVFTLTIQLFDIKIQTIYDKNDENDVFNYASFKELKFLVRRASILNSNAIISNKFLEFLKYFYRQIENKSENKIRENKTKIRKNKAKIEETDDVLYMNIYKSKIEKYKKEIKKYAKYLYDISEFTTFLAAQIKELLYKNEARSI
ncbi:hypothetical protein K8R66_04275, partial [bacterium]|nr:hypothetical protein [bacterium]